MDTELLLDTQDLQVVLRGKVSLRDGEMPYRVIRAARRWQEAGTEFLSDWHLLVAGGAKSQHPIALWHEGCVVWVTPHVRIHGPQVINLIMEVSEKIY